MTFAKRGETSYTLASWIYLLRDRGMDVADPAIEAACAALDQAEESAIGDLGEALTELVRAGLSGDEPAQLAAWLEQVFEGAVLGTDAGEGRDTRVRNARRYQFQRGMPWLARVVDRFPDGAVGAHWVLVEQVSDTVTCMDPYPWDDLDEEYAQPLGDFVVKWELADCGMVRLG